MTKMAHGIDYTQFAVVVADGRRTTRPVYADSAAPWLPAQVGDEVWVVDTHARDFCVGTLTEEDLKRGYVAAGAYRSAAGRTLINPVFLRPRTGHRNGDAYNASLSTWAGA